jgi:hypothetical protein
MTLATMARPYTPTQLGIWHSHLARVRRWLDLERGARDSLQRQTKLAYAMVYPDTGGEGHYLHNWYICRGDVDALALRRQWDQRRYRLSGYRELRRQREAHRAHIALGEVGRYLWCDECMATDEGKSYWAAD